MRFVLLPVIFLGALLTGCATQAPNPNPAVTLADSQAAVDLQSFDGFSDALVQSMGAKDGSLFAQRVDAKQFARRSLMSLGLIRVKDQSVNTYATILGKALQKRFQQTFAEVKTASFVRLMPEEARSPDTAVALIRIKPEGGGINYWKVHRKRPRIDTYQFKQYPVNIFS